MYIHNLIFHTKGDYDIVGFDNNTYMKIMERDLRPHLTDCARNVNYKLSSSPVIEKLCKNAIKFFTFLLFSDYMIYYPCVSFPYQ